MCASNIIDDIGIFQWIERELVRLERKINIAQMKGLQVEYPF
jgi:hypothetical protein